MWRNQWNKVGLDAKEKIFKFFLFSLDKCSRLWYYHKRSAGVAHLVERHLAKVEVASSSLVVRSKRKDRPTGRFFLLE